MHRSIEANWLTAPYDTRQGTDSFVPPQRWVSGAQRWTLGNLAAGQAVSFDVVLSILTGTLVPPGNSIGSCDGGSHVPGGSYFFTNWTENAVVVSTSPTFTFLAGADRTLVANFTAVGTGKVIATASTPTAGGTTSGDGEYALNTNATVSATPNSGYKFSKWLVNGATVSSAADYTFTSDEPRLLTARFITLPKITMATAAEPGKQVVSWPDAPGWVLQESAELATWATTTRAITTLNGQRSVTVDASAGKVFFRLKYQ